MSAEKIAEFDAGASFLSSQFQSIIDDSSEDDSITRIEDDIFEDLEEEEDIKVSKKPKGKTEEVSDEEEENDDDPKPEGNDQDEPEENEDEDDEYKDYSDSALYAIALKEQSPELFDFEIKQDLKPEELVQLLAQSYEEKINSAKEDISFQYDKAANYIDYLLSGMDPEVIREGLALQSVGNLEITEDTTEKELIDICKKGLILKGTTNQDDIDDFIETWKDKDKLFDKANEFIQLHKDYEEKLFENEQLRMKKQQEEFEKLKVLEQKEVKTLIEKGKVRGITIKDGKKLYDAIYKPTETIQYTDESGKKKVTKTTLYNKLYQEFNNDREQQVAFAYLLMEGFDFTKIVETAKKEVNKNVLDVLNNKTSKKTNNNRNPWLQ